MGRQARLMWSTLLMCALPSISTPLAAASPAGFLQDQGVSDAANTGARQESRSGTQDVTTLGEVRAIVPDNTGPPFDPNGFKNPITVGPNRFDKAYRQAPTPEEVSLNGGYILLGVYYGLAKAAQGIQKLTHAPVEPQHPIARPSPLSEEQLKRAAAFCAGADRNECTGRH